MSERLDQLRDDFEDPLAVRVGQWADIPADGWPAEFDPEVCERILGYLPEYED